MDTDHKKRILLVSADSALKQVLELCFKGWGYEVFLSESLFSDVEPVKRISPDVIVIDIYSASTPYLKICRLLKTDFLTAFIPVITIINKRQLKTHLLNLKEGVDDFVIKPPDPLDLRVRIEMVMRRAEYGFHTSPLTGLPGARIAEETVSERLKNNTTFSFGYIDIDNFKYFNDTYGYVKGDRVIMHTAYILYAINKKIGNHGDLIGHIGGDDFIFISTPNKYKAFCRELIIAFDRLIPFHYSEQDRRQGYIMAKDRTHTTKKVPLMSISLAVVSVGRFSPFKNIIQVNECIAEIKRYLKNIPGSKFMADRRESESRSNLSPVYAPRRTTRRKELKPLGQILLEKGVISPEQLDLALCAHWKRGVVCGEIFAEMGFLKKEEIEELVHKI